MDIFNDILQTDIEENERLNQELKQGAQQLSQLLTTDDLNYSGINQIYNDDLIYANGMNLYPYPDFTAVFPFAENDFRSVDELINSLTLRSRNVNNNDQDNFKIKKDITGQIMKYDHTQENVAKLQNLLNDITKKGNINKKEKSSSSRVNTVGRKKCRFMNENNEPCGTNARTEKGNEGFCRLHHPLPTCSKCTKQCVNYVLNVCKDHKKSFELENIAE